MIDYGEFEEDEFDDFDDEDFDEEFDDDFEDNFEEEFDFEAEFKDSALAEQEFKACALNRLPAGKDPAKKPKVEDVIEETNKAMEGKLEEEEGYEGPE
ncbi:MAG: hypothetical protein MPJ24_01430 [Pirellulaceae bacterium]|nr:hypothetical protein [Pirellulaceae bacterium]